MHRSLVYTLLALIVVSMQGFAQTKPAAPPAPSTATGAKIRLITDWRFDGSAAPLLQAVGKGYFKDEKLDVAITPGTGSAAAVGKVASGDFDIGVGDFSALVEFAANNPDKPIPQAVYVIFERMPAAVFALASSGIKTPKDLSGKRLGAPPFDGGRKMWPVFANAVGLTGSANWQNIDAADREGALAKGKVDAITGFLFTSMLSLEAQGVSGTDMVVMPFYQSGVRSYGNVVMVHPKFARENPKAVTAFLTAYNRSLKESIRDAEGAIKYLTAQVPEAKAQLEWRRLRLAVDSFIYTPTVQADGLGTLDAARVQQSIDTVASALNLARKPTVEQLSNASLMPALAERRLN